MDHLHVLIVDDEEELVDALVERLELRGIDAHGVNSGKEALQHIRQHSYDVVLLDVKMPDGGGLAVIREIKQIQPSLQVVLLTGHTCSQDAQEGMRLGAFEYLMKPVKLQNLMEVLRAAAKRGKS
ncbi:MAG: response regulator [Proteobacteria bacterium]|jgi:DNA-binding NtrC family response regulator|nr:response regulator [Pseudomonadota bacterium]